VDGEAKMPECIFCKIIRKEINAGVVYEDDRVLAFNDIAPQAPVHILVIPKEHAASFVNLQDFSVVGHIYQVIRQIAKQRGVEQDGFRVVVNHGRAAGQAVAHLHFHLLGGRNFSWPPG
jgi:histidine triad (HIT) family protein